MDRRRFLQLVTGAGVTTATMAEAGFFAEFWKWATKRTKYFIPKEPQKFYEPTSVYELLYDPLELDPPITANLDHLAKIYYDRKAVEALNSRLALDRMSVIRHIQQYGYSHVKVKWHK